MLGTKILEERKSDYNGKLVVAKSLGYGTYIQSDGLTQSGGIVETIWKGTLRSINHKPLIINNCLILGLGGGTVSKLIKKYWPGAKITGVEIDPAMIELGQKYLDLDKKDIEIVIGDASDYLFKTRKPAVNHYDLIIIDLYNGDKFPEKFETTTFLRKIKYSLSADGLVIFNRLYYGDKRPEAVRFGNKLKDIFDKVDWFYPEANLMLICKK